MASDGFSGDAKAHEGTYGGFVSLLKVSSAVAFVVAMIVIFLIAS